MSELRKAAQQALAAMDYMLNNGEWYQAQDRADALRAALAQPEQEPVLWMMPDGKIVDKWALQFYGGQAGEPLYKAPPQRKPLTEEEVLSVLRLSPPEPSLWPQLKDEAVVGDVQKAVLAIARAIERAHGIEFE